MAGNETAAEHHKATGHAVFEQRRSPGDRAWCCWVCGARSENWGTIHNPPEAPNA